MKCISFFCLVMALMLVVGCKKQKPEPSQQTDIRKQSQPAKVKETVDQTKQVQADTQSITAESTTATKPAEMDQDPKLIASMQRAVSVGDTEIIQSLLSSGADVNAKYNNGTTLLHIALLQGHEAMAALLISKGADTHAKMTDGTTTLHFAVLRNCKEIVKFLLDDGVDANAMSTNFGSPLHLAANTGHAEIAEMLIAKGADVNIKNQRDQTPLEVAKQKNNTAILELMEKNGAE